MLIRKNEGMREASINGSAAIACAIGAVMVLFSLAGVSCNNDEATGHPYVCANGTVATGAISLRPNITWCFACDSGYRLERGACAANSHRCANGVAAEGNPEVDGTHQCATCNKEYSLRDGICVANSYSCVNGRAKDGRPLTSDALNCVSCDIGYRRVESATGAICEPNEYTCANGTPEGGRPAVDGENSCLVCDSYYHLGEQGTCVENEYACDNGTVRQRQAQADPPATHNQQFCVSCDTDYFVYSDSATGSQICGGNNYICFNGVASDEIAPNRGTQLCVSCHTGYRLENERCVPHEYTCPGGTAASGIPAVDGVVRCASCDTPHQLKGIECVVWEYPLGLAAIGNTLYMTGDRFKRLYVVNTDTAGARPVNPTAEVGFGVGEYAPTGLGAVGDTLYMVGLTQKRLYTLDTTTGLATAVGNARHFGVGETYPRDLAVVRGTLYMVGDSSLSDPTVDRWNQLYVIDTATGVASMRGGLYLADWFRYLRRPRGLAAIGDTLYVTDGQINRVYRVDTGNGGVYRLPQDMVRTIHNSTGFGIGEYSSTGMAAIGETLYLAGYNSLLYTLDTLTGSATLVGRIAP